MLASRGHASHAITLNSLLSLSDHTCSAREQRREGRLSQVTENNCYLRSVRGQTIDKHKELDNGTYKYLDDLMREWDSVLDRVEMCASTTVHHGSLTLEPLERELQVMVLLDLRHENE